jgi:peptidylprolyl isomerase
MFKFLSALAGAAIVTSAASAAPEGFIATSSGVLYHDSVVGTGPEPQTGQTVVVNYTGWLDAGDGKHGAKFDSSLDRNQPFSFVLGTHQVIAGWDTGVATMHVGGKRTLIIPAEQGYGERGAGSAIPPGATLVFDVELLAIK